MLLGALLRRYVEGDAVGFRVRRWRDARQRARLRPESSCRLVCSLDTNCAGSGSCSVRPGICLCLPAAISRVLAAAALWAQPIATQQLVPTLHHLVLVVAPPVPQDSMTAEAAELATASFGDVMLGAIGGVYKTQADIVLGGFFDGGLVALRHAPLFGSVQSQRGLSKEACRRVPKQAVHHVRSKQEHRGASF